MKARQKRILCCMGSAMLLTIALSVPTFAESTSDVWADKVAADVRTSANIRSDASIESNRVGRLPKGAAATAIGEKDGWVKISSDEVEGYIRGDLLASAEDAKSLYVSTYGSEEITVGASKIEENTQEKNTQEKNTQEKNTEQASSEAVEASSSDLDLMAAIIECEAGGESADGKIAVGAVIMNRINSSRFPDSLSGVIYQGGQFSPVASGKLSRVLARGAHADCYEAARAVFNGANTIGDKLFFNSGHGKGIQIGNQHFY